MQSDILIIIIIIGSSSGQIFHLTINNQIRTSIGEVHPFFTPDSPYPLNYKTAETLQRSVLSCDWIKHKHYCRLHHFLTCLRAEQLQESTRRSYVYVSAAGGLGNHMSTFAATLALGHRAGFQPLIDLTGFQILDQVFNNIRGAGLQILEEVICDPASLVWDSFDGHISDLKAVELSQGRMVVPWLSGVSVAEHVSGVAELVTPYIDRVRKTFTFRNEISKEVREKLETVVDDYVAKHNRKKKKAKISRDSCDLVGVHVRRRDHLQYEERMKYSKLNKNYFLQSMDLYKERLSHPIFLIVTDDPDWVRTQIPHHYFNHYTTDFYNSSSSSAGLDLAALSLCNYLVLSRGTFGGWSSILSGAMRITPKHATEPTLGGPFLLRNQVPTVDFSQHWMPENWRVELAGRCPECLERHPAQNSLLRGTQLNSAQ